MKTIVAVALLGALAACATTGTTSRAALMEINPGMTRDEVIARLGAPGNRSFDANLEALQYCRTGMMADEYSTIWFADGRVVSLTTILDASAMGSCAGQFPIVDWGHLPPDVRIAIERN